VAVLLLVRRRQPYRWSDGMANLLRRTCTANADAVARSGCGGAKVMSLSGQFAERPRGTDGRCGWADTPPSSRECPWQVLWFRYGDLDE
jgi:hypothetical protein